VILKECANTQLCEMCLNFRRHWRNW